MSPRSVRSSTLSPKLTAVGGTGEDVMEADGEGVQGCRVRLVRRWLWHGPLLPGHVSGAGWRAHCPSLPGSDVRGATMET
jgi:hypothetical protein